MRQWSTDPSPQADTRLARWFVRLGRHRAPDWLLRALYPLAQRRSGA